MNMGVSKRRTFDESGTDNTRAAMNCMEDLPETEERLALRELLVKSFLDSASPSLSVMVFLAEGGGNSRGTT